MIAMHAVIWYALHLEFKVKLLFVIAASWLSRWLVTARGQMRSQASPLGVCDGFKRHWGTFTSIASVFICHIYINAAYSFTHH